VGTDATNHQVGRPGPGQLAAGTALRTGRLYGGLCAAYLAGNSIAHPQSMTMPLTHFATWPTEAETFAVALALSFVCSIVLACWPLGKGDPRKDRFVGGRRPAQ
jgi:hypothetical protein